VPAFVDRIQQRIHDARQDHPGVDRLVRTQEHYGRVNAGQQAGAVTYFGFLSIFPILAVSFFVVGYIVKIYPDAREDLRDAIERVLPGLIGSHNGQVSLSAIENAAGTVGLIGLVGLLYAGLGWVSSLRNALVVVFEVPAKQRPNFFIGKARDLVTLVVLGLVLLVAVALTDFARGFSEDVIGWVGLSADLGWLVDVVAVVIGLVVNAALFFGMFLLAEPTTPRRSLWEGAALGGVGFEALKLLSSYLLAASRGTPAFQVFGTALILLLWINYFSRVILYAATFAYVSATARAARDQAYAAARVQGPQSPPLELPDVPPGPVRGPGAVTAFLVGAGSMVGVLAVLKKMGRSGK
jgi:membrane protein